MNTHKIQVFIKSRSHCESHYRYWITHPPRFITKQEAFLIRQKWSNHIRSINSNFSSNEMVQEALINRVNHGSQKTDNLKSKPSPGLIQANKDLIFFFNQHLKWKLKSTQRKRKGCRFGADLLKGSGGKNWNKKDLQREQIW